MPCSSLVAPVGEGGLGLGLGLEYVFFERKIRGSKVGLGLGFGRRTLGEHTEGGSGLSLGFDSRSWVAYP